MNSSPGGWFEELEGSHATRINGGGDISEVYRVERRDGSCCAVKTRPGAPPEFFAAEAFGLDWLSQTQTLRVPQVVCLSRDFLALEWLDSAIPVTDFDRRLGLGLAALHRYPAGKAGGVGPNFIGSLAQDNQPCDSWANFYVERRLRPQLEMALQKGLAPPGWRQRFERLYQALPGWLPDEPLSRLHGDLWNGNHMVGPLGEPCLVDPSVYVGHREVDLAMMRLFGGFGPEVWQAYQEAFPLSEGHQERVALYQLYPLLVHLNLFGSGYRPALENTLRSLPGH